MKDVLFICQIIPSNLLTKYPVSPAQTHFCDGIIGTGYFGKIISLIQTNVVPYMVNEIEDGRDIEYIQVRLLPQNKWTRLFNNFIENLKIVISCTRYNNIVYNNINHQTILSCIINKCIFRKKVYAIITDHTPPCSFFSFQTLLELLFKRLDGVIALSSRMIIPNQNKYSIAGIVPVKTIKPFDKSKTYNNTILFSGTLNEAKGIRLALECISDEKDMQLLVTGDGPLRQVVEEYDSRYDNIRYLGFLDDENYSRVLDNVSICLSLRNPKLEENNNNFPSKVLEYFANNKIVISTIEYPELCGINYFTCDYNKKSLSCCIKNVLTHLEKDTMLLDNATNLKNAFSEDAWIRAFNKVIFSTI